MDSSEERTVNWSLRSPVSTPAWTPWSIPAAPTVSWVEKRNRKSSLPSTPLVR